MDELFDLELFFESSPDLLCVAGVDGYFKKVNQAFLVTLGYTTDELLSRPISSFIHEEDLLFTFQKRQNLQAGETLLNFENRYITKTGEVIWLSWSSAVLIASKDLIFAIAKNTTHEKKIKEYQRIADVIDTGETDLREGAIMTNSDQIWLVKLEEVVRTHIGKADLTVALLSSEMAMSERQFFRRVKAIVGLTPNKYIRIIRFQFVQEALKTGKYRTVSEIAIAAGFKTPGYFSKLFKEVYGNDITTFM